MNKNEFLSVVDYYLGHQSTPSATYISILALVVSIGSAIWSSMLSSRSLQDADRRHIRVEWNGILDTCVNHPQFVDIGFVSNYLNQDRNISLIYEAFCLKAWSLVEFISKRELKREEQYFNIVQWVVAYHRDWLELNWFLFPSDEFRDIYNGARDEPLVRYRPRMLPRTEGKPFRPDADRYTDSVDWDRVHGDYHDWVISPLAPVMVTPDPDKSDKIRNVLITRLLQFPDLKNKRILDYGCGPGNLLEVVAGKVGTIYGLDISSRALAIASEKAARFKVPFVPIRGDMRSYISDEKFDLIISINSVLPAKRADVARMLRNIRENLSDGGRLLTIVPSFDTCLALADYIQESYERRSKHKNHAEMCADSFRKAKKMDKETLSFADDGVHIQCFHDKASIQKEFPEAGLRIVGEPKKVEYPWKYARNFDYGFFPDKPEIWDWFVEAEKAPVPTNGAPVEKTPVTAS